MITHDSLSESLAVMQHQEATPCAKPCIAPPAIERSDWNRLLEIWTEIGPNARAALMMIGERLRVGRKVYDDDFTDDRDWDQMALEEDLDGCVYRAVKKVREIRGR